MIQLWRPCRGRITQWFANIQSHDGRKHTGNDYAYYTDGQVMDEVFAAADGVVQFAGDSRALNWPNRWYINPDFDRSDAQDSSAGNFIAITHNQAGVRFDTTYSHLAAWTVKVGDYVTAGQRIATIGATGFSAGKHLHFELLFHPFNFGTDTYGRSDPNLYIATGGLAAMGSPTESLPEEPLVPNESDRVFWPIEGSEKVSLNELLNSIDRKSSAANAKVDLLVEAIGSAVTFTAIDGNTVSLAEQLRSLDTKAERERAENAALRAALDAVTTNSTVTPEQIQATIQEALKGFSITLTTGGQ